jgi:Putative GTPases (G3E family)
MKKIPVIIVSGFLGSGKTTIINSILAKSKGSRIGVIVNDFGSINIDSLLIVSQTIETVELASGCICCMMDGNSLEEPLQKLTENNQEFDAIIIEASGLAEPREITHKLLSVKNDKVKYGGLIYVIDCINFDTLHKQHHAQVETSIKTADLLILNKQVAPDRSSSIFNLCKNLAPNTLAISTNDGGTDPRILFDVRQDRQKQLKLSDSVPHDNHDLHLHYSYQSVSFETKIPLDPSKFIDFAQHLQPTIYRIKGFIYFGMKGLEQKFVFHKVGSYKSIDSRPWNEDNPTTKLVLIGTDLDKDLITKSLENLIDDDPNNITDESIIKIPAKS